MSLKTESPKTNIKWSEGYEGYKDLTGNQYCAVAASGASTGETKITTPSAGGVACIGILISDDCDTTHRGEVVLSGVCPAKTGAVFNCGVLLMAGDTEGKLITATSGNYVIARAREASTVIGQIIAVEVLQSPFQLN